MTLDTTPTAVLSRVEEPANLDELKNYALIVGTLERGGRDNASRVIARRYSDKGAAVDQMRIQVLDAGGTVAYGMRLAVPSALRMQMGEQVAKLNEGQRIKVWGYLNRPVAYDGRFRDPRSQDPDAGREFRETIIEVQGMALASDEDLDGTLVVLEGRVLTPPFIGTHDTDVALDVARTTLEVRWSFQPRPDRPSREVKDASLPVEVPLLLEDASALFAVGNIVRVEGRLEPFVERLRVDRAPNPSRRRAAGEETPNPVVTALARLDASWDEERKGLTGEVLVRAERDYFRRRQSLQQDRGLRVRVGYVSLITGELITVTEARKQRAQRLERRRAAAARRGGERPMFSVEAQAQVAAEQRSERQAEGDREAVLQTPPARPARPRRQSLQQVVEAEASSPATEVAEVVITSVSSENGQRAGDELAEELLVVVEA